MASDSPRKDSRNNIKGTKRSFMVRLTSITAVPKWLQSKKQRTSSPVREESKEETSHHSEALEKVELPHSSPDHRYKLSLPPVSSPIIDHSGLTTNANTRVTNNLTIPSAFNHITSAAVTFTNHVTRSPDVKLQHPGNFPTTRTNYDLGNRFRNEIKPRSAFMNVFDTLSRGLRMKARLPVLEQEVGTISKTIEQHRREMNASSLLFTENCSSSPGNAARERPPRLSSHFNSTSPIQAVTSPLGREVATDRIRTPEKRERMASPATVDIRTPVQRMSTQERRQSLQASILSRESMSPIQLPEKAEEFGQGYGKHATQDYPDLFKMMNNLNLGSTTVKEQEDAEVQRLKAMKERLNRSGEAKLKISPFVSVPRPFLPSFEPPLREFKVEEDEEEEEIEEDEYFGPAIEEIETFIDERLESGDDVLIEKFNIEIRHKDLKTLEGLNWLNDEIINFYFSLIMERSKIVENYPSVHVMNTFFYTTLTKKGFASVKRWTRKVDIFSMDFVLIPLHLGVHWTLCSVNNQKKRISYYDSMGGGRINQSGTKHLSVILNYLKEEYEDKKKSPLPTDYEANEVGVNDDGLENVRIPQQDNGSDCGVFTCKFAEYISRRATFTFSQDHMPYFRRKMIFEILKGELH